MNLHELRKSLHVTQKEASNAVGIPLRTYLRYEANENYGDAMKREAIKNKLASRYEISEEKGVLSAEQIRGAIKSVLDAYYKNEVSFCYLFGSYAKGTPNDHSDVDLYIDSSLSGFALTGLMERLRGALHKKLDVIRPSELENNIALTNEIMKSGIKIYG